jgi:hypothetical protein
VFVLTGVHRISQIQAAHVLRLQQRERDLVIPVDLSRLARPNSCALPYKLVYKSPLRYKSPWFISPPLAEGRCPALTKFVWRTDHLHSKSLCYKSPPREGHLSRTGHIGGTYKPVYTVALVVKPILTAIIAGHVATL